MILFFFFFFFFFFLTIYLLPSYKLSEDGYVFLEYTPDFVSTRRRVAPPMFPAVTSVRVTKKRISYLGIRLGSKGKAYRMLNHHTSSFSPQTAHHTGAYLMQRSLSSFKTTMSDWYLRRRQGRQYSVSSCGAGRYLSRAAALCKRPYV